MLKRGTSSGGGWGAWSIGQSIETHSRARRISSNIMTSRRISMISRRISSNSRAGNGISSSISNSLFFIPKPRTLATTSRSTSNLGFFQIPPVQNEPFKHYAIGSEERANLEDELKHLQATIHKVPCIINGKRIFMEDAVKHQLVCANHKQILCSVSQANPKLVAEAIKGGLEAKLEWERMPFVDRAAIFLKAADLLSTRYRYKVIAATMLGQGKNIWQGEIDAAGELIDFWRFNCSYAQNIYMDQPQHHSFGVWNRLEYRPLEGFISAISPFNFTAIGGNLASAPALMGNVVLWKPSAMAVLSNYLVYTILEEAGLPPGVIQFLPGPASAIVETMLGHSEFAGLHFTGSTKVFKSLWRQIAERIDTYKNYPRLVGETGGKNMHFVHSSAQVENVVNQTIRGAFEYQGQKCSASSRIYVPNVLWPRIKERLVEEIGKLKIGTFADPSTFCGPVINKEAFDRISKYIHDARTSTKAKILAGGECDDSVGYFIQPTLIQAFDPHYTTMEEEIFGPVLTAYVYPEAEYERYLELANQTSPYGLTAALFAQDREAIIRGTEVLRNCAGNFYVNDKSTGALVGQQPFGGSRHSGTNDKAGSVLNLLRWVSPRTIKENFLPLEDWKYPSNAK